MEVKIKRYFLRAMFVLGLLLAHTLLTGFASPLYAETQAPLFAFTFLDFGIILVLPFALLGLVYVIVRLIRRLGGTRIPKYEVGLILVIALAALIISIEIADLEPVSSGQFVVVFLVWFLALMLAYALVRLLVRMISLALLAVIPHRIDAHKKTDSPEAEHLTREDAVARFKRRTGGGDG